MSQANNFYSAFPGHPRSVFYGKSLCYIPGVDHMSARERAHVTVTPGSVIGAPLHVELNSKFSSTFAVLDPNTDIPDQLERAIAAGFPLVELGAPSGTGLGDFMMMLTHIHGIGLGVIAKNAMRSVGPMQYMGHPNVFGCVVERNGGSPREYDRQRRDVRKDGLMPVWFVFDGPEGVDQCADEIKLHDLKGMGVSFGAGLSSFKYDDSHVVLNPRV